MEEEKSIENLKAEIVGLHNELFVSTEEKKSLKVQIEELHNTIVSLHNENKDKFSKIQNYYAELFQNTETRKSIEEQIGGFYKQLFEDSESNKSIKNEIQTLLDKTKSDYEAFTKQNTKINAFSDHLFTSNDQNDSLEERIDEFYNKLFSDNESEKSLNSQFQTLLASLNERFLSTNEKFIKLEAFYSSVFEDQKNEEGKITKPSLITSIDNQKNRLTKLITEANEKLYALTDSSLHNAFAKRAEEYTKEFCRLEGLTHKLTWAVIADILLFGIVQIILVLASKGFDYHILIYQFSIAGALIFAIWMFNRNQKIAKKLAEEYHHKAAIAEAMTGYRQLYNLEHEDGEYMELFNSLKDQLNINPSKAIDKFLNLKSPQEELSGTIKSTFNTDKLKELAEALKPYQ